MRRPERIPIFLELIDGKLTEVILNCYNLNFDGDVLQQDVRLYYGKLPEIERFWTDNPDLRFSQVLIAKEIIPNIPGSWYYMEENDILKKLGIEPREYLLWGQVFDKDMNRLPEPIYRPIKDLDTGHIQAILDGNWCRLDNYKECFKNELKLRGIT